MNPLRKWSSIYVAAIGKGVASVAGLPSASAFFQFATRVDPDNHEAIGYQGTIYMLNNENERAIEYFDQALRRKQAWYHFANRGSAYRRTKRYEQAILDFNKALEFEPNSLISYYERGITYYQMGDLNAAQADLQVVLSKELNFTLAHLYMALIYHDKGDYEGASSEYGQAVRLDGSLPKKMFEDAVQSAKGTTQDRQGAAFMLRNILALSTDVQLRKESQLLLQELED